MAEATYGKLSHNTHISTPFYSHMYMAKHLHHPLLTCLVYFSIWYTTDGVTSQLPARTCILNEQGPY